MKESMSVYEALREHILQKECQITNEIIYMYVTYFALLTIASIWNDWMSLMTFIDLIVFQSLINEEQWEIGKASVYIEIFFEKQYDDIHWETLHRDPFYIAVFSGSIRKTIGWYISKCGSSILSILSFLSIFIRILHASSYQLFSISFDPAMRIVLAFLLCMITICVNRQYFSVREGERLKRSLTEAIKEFHANMKSN